MVAAEVRIWPHPLPAQLIVTIVTGIPGSHQDTLCSTLLELGREVLRWTLLRQPFEVTSPFDRESEKSFPTKSQFRY